jgi:hypothetical protein
LKCFQRLVDGESERRHRGLPILLP